MNPRVSLPPDQTKSVPHQLLTKPCARTRISLKTSPSWLFPHTRTQCYTQILNPRVSLPPDQVSTLDQTARTSAPNPHASPSWLLLPHREHNTLHHTREIPLVSPPTLSHGDGPEPAHSSHGMRTCNQGSSRGSGGEDVGNFPHDEHVIHHTTHIQGQKEFCVPNKIVLLAECVCVCVCMSCEHGFSQKHHKHVKISCTKPRRHTGFFSYSSTQQR